jgi:protein SCO1/2
MATGISSLISSPRATAWGCWLSGRARLLSGLARSFAAAAAVGASLLAVSPAQGQLNQLPQQAVGLQVVEKLGESIPLDVEFLDPEGNKVTLAKYFNTGKPVVLAMVYFRCPLLCPMLLNNLQQKLNDISLKMGEQYNLVLVSFDPSEGPGEAIKQREGLLAGYNRATPKNIRDSFAVLTGTAASSQRLADGLGFPYKYLPESGEYSHGTVIFTLTPEGRISRYIYGVNYSPETLRMSLLEASDGMIGTVIDRAIMWCFQFHPGSGGYVFQAMRVMQAAAVVLTLMVGAILVRMYFIEVRRRRGGLLAVGQASDSCVPPAPSAR